VAVRSLVLLTVSFLVSASSASAQWSVSAFLGKAATSPTRLEIRSGASDAVALDRVHLDDKSMQLPWYYGWRVTRRVQRVSWLAFEAEFIHAKTIANTTQLVRAQGRVNGAVVDAQLPMHAVLTRFELSHGLNFLLGNAVIRWPIGSVRHDPRVTIVGRVGAGPTIPHVESTFQGQAENGYQFGRVGVGGGIGAEVRLVNRLFAVGDVKVTTTRQNVSVGSAEIEGRFTTRHVMGGLMWRFAQM
jgi:hypothetical protein